MKTLKTKEALRNNIHDLMLVDIYKCLISHPKTFWSLEDNRQRYIVTMPESWAGKDIIIHWGPSLADPKDSKTVVKCVSGNHRAVGVVNLELKTTSNPNNISSRLGQATDEAMLYNSYFSSSINQKPSYVNYAFSVGVACCIDHQSGLQCGAITINANTERRPRLVKEFYNSIDLFKGLNELFDLIEDPLLYSEKPHFDPYAKICDGVMGMPSQETPPDDDYPVIDMWDSTPPPQPQAEVRELLDQGHSVSSIQRKGVDKSLIHSEIKAKVKAKGLDQTKAKYKAKIENDVLLTKALKAVAISLLDLVGEDQASPWMQWIDFAKALEAPLNRVKRSIPSIAEAQVFNLEKEHTGQRKYQYRIVLNKEYIKA